MIVFAAVIKYLKQHLVTNLEKGIARTVNESDIHWVLTIPAIWNEPAKQFMREAVVEV